MSNMEGASARPDPDALAKQDDSAGSHGHAVTVPSGHPSRADQPMSFGGERAIVQLPCMGTSEGMTVAAIAASIVEDEQTVYHAMRELARLNVVEPTDSGTGSQRWRLVAH